MRQRNAHNNTKHFLHRYTIRICLNRVACSIKWHILHRETVSSCEYDQSINRKQWRRKTIYECRLQRYQVRLRHKKLSDWSFYNWMIFTYFSVVCAKDEDPHSPANIYSITAAWILVDGTNQVEIISFLLKSPELVCEAVCVCCVR